jgi:uncharacterized protein YqfA (UPF0365 family)
VNSAALILVLVLVFFVLVFVLIGPWIHFGWLWAKARQHALDISILQIIGMQLRRIPPGRVIAVLARLRASGMTGVSAELLESHHLAGGDIERVGEAVIRQRAQETAKIMQICADDLRRLGQP